MKRLLFMLLLGAACHFTWAQNIFPVKGNVKDKQNNPLEGVTVTIKGTSIAATSDADGNFSISVEKGKVLEFSYAGMQTTEVTVSNANDI
ncbi:MAG TPA: carboxypeptidase-like regulatory domain-containing protein, partial [Niabella sp.]|nr:carboxypeptidase-like regulatory domain-containing protein [Niabella sp.]